MLPTKVFSVSAKANYVMDCMENNSGKPIYSNDCDLSQITCCIAFFLHVSFAGRAF